WSGWETAERRSKTLRLLAVYWTQRPANSLLLRQASGPTARRQPVNSWPIPSTLRPPCATRPQTGNRRISRSFCRQRSPIRWRALPTRWLRIIGKPMVMAEAYGPLTEADSQGRATRKAQGNSSFPNNLLNRFSAPGLCSRLRELMTGVVPVQPGDLAVALLVRVGPS